MPEVAPPTRLSAGVVIVSVVNRKLKFLLLRAYRNWDFPKGLVEAGEEPIDAAVRAEIEDMVKALAKRTKAARTAAAEVSDLSRSADVESYSATAQSAGFESSLQAVDSTYSALYSALGG